MAVCAYYGRRKLSSGIGSKPVTWDTVYRAGLGWGAEYGVLSMIEDSSVALRAATIFCALGALGALEMHSRAEEAQKKFWNWVAAAVFGLWLVFIWSAISHAMHIQTIRAKLRDMYLESSQIVARAEIVSENSASSVQSSQKERRDIIDLAKVWTRTTSAWIEKHAGPVTRERFLDSSAMPNLSWTGPNQPQDVQFSSVVDLLVIERRNLATLIDSQSYD